MKLHRYTPLSEVFLKVQSNHFQTYTPRVSKGHLTKNRPDGSSWTFVGLLTNVTRDLL